MNVGEALELKPLVSPEVADGEMTWNTDNPSVATVSRDGVVTALTSGKAVVTMTSDAGEQIAFVVRANEAADVLLFDMGDDEITLDIDEDFDGESAEIDAQTPVEIQTPVE